MVALMVLGLTLGVTTLPAFAQNPEGGHPSAKATTQFTAISVLDSSAQGIDPNGEPEWTTLLSNTIHTSSQKSLFIDVSLECGLFTRTQVKSKGGNKDTSSASATIQVRVMVDNEEAYPGSVVFASRMQQLSAVFQGLLTDAEGNVCLSADPDTGDITIDEDCLQPEELELILDTMTANSFNFVTQPLESGVHSVDIQVRIKTGDSFDEGQAEAAATVGKGTFTVEEVRLIKNEDIVLE
jgi:hypothetical protein